MKVLSPLPTCPGPHHNRPRPNRIAFLNPSPPPFTKGRGEEINPWPTLEGWSGEEVLERHVLKYGKVSQAIITIQLFLPRTTTHNIRARILELSNPDRPSSYRASGTIFSQLQGSEGDFHSLCLIKRASNAKKNPLTSSGGEGVLHPVIRYS